jgi:hypothetical protein
MTEKDLEHKASMAWVKTKRSRDFKEFFPALNPLV